MVKEIFKLAWDRYTLHLGGLLVTTLLMCILYLILLKLTILGGELLKPFFLYGMFNVILNYSEDNFPEIEVQVKEDDVEDFVKKIRHRPGRIDFSHFLAGFSDKHIAFKLLCYGFLKMIFLAIGFALLVVPGIYFEFATIFALPLILKKDLDKKYKYDPFSIKEIVNNLRSAKEVEVSLFLKELEPDKKYKLSFRSKGLIDVNKLANHFDGGGHQRAAGAVVEGTVQEIVAEIKKELQSGQYELFSPDN
jgi:hypothetical protein